MHVAVQTICRLRVPSKGGASTGLSRSWHLQDTVMRVSVHKAARSCLQVVRCEGTSGSSAPEACNRAHSDAVFLSSCSSFVSQSLLSFLLVSLCYQT